MQRRRLPPARAISAQPENRLPTCLWAPGSGELLWLESHFLLVLPFLKAKLNMMAEEVLLLKGYCHLQREKGGTKEHDALAHGTSLSVLTIQHKFWKSQSIREIRNGICWLGMKAGLFLKAFAPGPSMLQLNATQATEHPYLCPCTELTGAYGVRKSYHHQAMINTEWC